MCTCFSPAPKYASCLLLDSCVECNTDAMLGVRHRREARIEAAEEPLLSSFYHASILSHDSFARSLAFVLANRLADATLLATELFEVFHQVRLRCAELPPDCGGVWQARHDPRHEQHFPAERVGSAVPLAREMTVCNDQNGWFVSSGAARERGHQAGRPAGHRGLLRAGAPPAVQVVSFSAPPFKCNAGPVAVHKRLSTSR